MNKVTVNANKDGNLISISKNNPLWGWIRLTQSRNIISEDGVLKVRNISALVQGWTKDLNTLGWEDGMELPGNIIFKDSLTPFDNRNPERDLKIAGESMVVLKKDDQPIYRKYFYTVSPTAEDVYVAHDNADEIREAYAALRSEEDNVSNKDFSL